MAASLLSNDLLARFALERLVAKPIADFDFDFHGVYERFDESTMPMSVRPHCGSCFYSVTSRRHAVVQSIQSFWDGAQEPNACDFGPFAGPRWFCIWRCEVFPFFIGCEAAQGRRQLMRNCMLCRCIKALANGWLRSSTTNRRLLLQALLVGDGRNNDRVLSRRHMTRAHHRWLRCEAAFFCSLRCWMRAMACCCQRVRSSATWSVTMCDCFNFITQPRTVCRIARACPTIARTCDVGRWENLSCPRLSHRCRTNVSARRLTVTVKSRCGERAMRNKLRGIAGPAERALLDRPSRLGDATRHSSRSVCNCAKCGLEVLRPAEFQTPCRRAS